MRALDAATKKVPRGRPYDLEIEHYRGKEVWKIKVASGRDRPHEFYVSSDGRQIVRRNRHKFDDDAAKALKARVTLRDAVRTAAKRVNWRLEEAEIDRHRGTLVWEVEFAERGREREVLVNATTGAVIRVQTKDD